MSFKVSISSTQPVSFRSVDMRISKNFWDDWGKEKIPDPLPPKQCENWPYDTRPEVLEYRLRKKTFLDTESPVFHQLQEIGFGISKKDRDYLINEWNNVKKNHQAAKNAFKNKQYINASTYLNAQICNETNLLNKVEKLRYEQQIKKLKGS